MKTRVRAISEDEILESFPIRGRTPGWLFRVREISNNAWVVEGADQWGRRVSRDGGDPDRLLVACEADAAAIGRSREKP